MEIANLQLVVAEGERQQLKFPFGVKRVKNYGEECNRCYGSTASVREESLDFIEKGASEMLGAARLRKVQQKTYR